MSELPSCVYCGNVVDDQKGYWVLERWENGRSVARGAACSPGCLHAVTGLQGPRVTPLTRGMLPRIEYRVIEPGEHPPR
jgi:hypothetical protein